ncbi:MAG: hypothetical protein AAGB12_15910, partial [Pseudomonadota bacterium]
TLTDDNSGELNGLVFEGFTDLIGGTGDDSFIIETGGTLSGVMDGGAGHDTVNLQAVTRDLVVGLEGEAGASASVDFNLSEMETINANGDQNNRLIATDADNTWTLDGVNSGTLAYAGTTPIEFSGFANLIGGSLSDSFNFTNSGDISGVIDGRGGSDQLNIANLQRDISVSLNTNDIIASESLLFVQGIETLQANAGRQNTLIGTDVNTTWQINGIGTDSLPNSLLTANNLSVAFSGFDTFVGGNLDDSFIISDVTDLRFIDGGNGVNLTDFSNVISDIEIFINNSAVASELTLNQVQTIIGNNNGQDDSFSSGITLLAGQNRWFIENSTSRTDIDGINDGTIEREQGDVIRFINFNDLQGGTGIDDFVVRNGGTLMGSIHGGEGNDSLLTTLVSNGQLNFIGGAGDDSLQLTGGDTTINASYINNVDGFDVLSYTDGDVINGLVNYSGVESISDQVIAQNFTILGSNAVDIIQLGDGFIAVNDAARVNFSNKANLILDGDVEDTFNLATDLDLGIGSLTINNAFLTNTSDSLLTAESLLINGAGVGTAANRLNTRIDVLAMNNVLNDVYLNETDALQLDNINTGSIVDLIAGGEVTQTLGSLINSNNAFSIQAEGNLFLTNQNQLLGAVSLVSGNRLELTNTQTTNLVQLQAESAVLTSSGDVTAAGSITVNDNFLINAFESNVLLNDANNNFSSLSILSANNVSVVDQNSLILNSITIDGELQVTAQNIVNDNDVVAGSIVFDVSENLNIDNPLQSTIGNISLTANQVNQNANIISANDITLDSQESIIMDSVVSSQAQGNIIYSSNDNIALALLSSNQGEIAVSSDSGQIIDNNDDNNNLVGQRAQLNALNGIGIDDALETQLTSLFAENGQGEININNRGSITIERLATLGDIEFNNANLNGSDILIGSDSIDAGFDVGQLIMTTEGGSFLGVDTTPDFDNPDIIAKNVTFADVLLQGNFGAIDRPLVLKVRDSALISVQNSLNPQFDDPSPEINDSDSLFKFSSFDSVSVISAGQLIVLEELFEIDPAIFTDLQNYLYEDIAIQMPRDQLYEDYDEDNAVLTSNES